MNVIDLGTGLDLDRVQLANEVAANEDFSSLIIKASIDGIVACDLQGRYTLWNRAMEKLTGITQSQVFGKTSFEIFPFLKEHGLDRVFSESAKGQTVTSPPFQYRIPATGASGIAQQTDSPIYNEIGQIVGVLIIVRDVTQTQQALDQLREENELLKKRLLTVEGQ